MNNGNREHVSVCKSAPPPQCGLHTQTLSLSVALSLAPALQADFSGQCYCVDILSKSSCKSRGVFITKCGFRESIYMVIHDCKCVETTWNQEMLAHLKTITAR